MRQARFSFFKCFDGIVVSSHEGVAKPDAEIFRRVLQRFNLEAARTLLVDDAERNVDAARALGWKAILFTSSGALLGALVQLGLLPAAASGR